MCIGAFFDIDGTLLDAPSLEARFLRYLRWRGELGVAAKARWSLHFLQRVGAVAFELNRAAESWILATQGNKAHLRGLRAGLLHAWTAALAQRPLEFFPEALDRLNWHAAHGHHIFLVSGTLEPLANVVAAQLSVPVEVCATRLAVAEGWWTGDVIGEGICGPAKARAVERLALERNLDLARSYAYGNRWADHWMLDRVGHPIVVNPSLMLARLAQRRGWPAVQWVRKPSGGVAPRRPLAAPAAWRGRAL